MAKIAWKVINGYGAYAYLQRSVKSSGKVASEHLAYMGKVGTRGLVPGTYVLTTTGECSEERHSTRGQSRGLNEGKK